jgi:hypothetical protein
MRGRSLILMGALAGGLAAADPAPAPDWVATLHARRALWNDPALAELNIGVRVREGVALVFGPVMNEQQAAEAIARVRLAPGIHDVVNELYVLPANDLLRKRFAPPPKPQAALTVARPLPMPADPLEEARRSDPRFSQLRIVVDRGVVTVSGPADVAAEFAERIRRLPGVDQVRRGSEAHSAGAERRP